MVLGGLLLADPFTCVIRALSELIIEVSGNFSQLVVAHMVAGSGRARTDVLGLGELLFVVRFEEQISGSLLILGGVSVC